MSISDRTCPKCGDLGATPQMSFCPGCGSQLVMKSTLRSTAESIIPAAILGGALGAGLSLGDHLADAIAGGLSDLLDF